MKIDDSLVREKLSPDQRSVVEQLADVSAVAVIRAIQIGHSGAAVFVVQVESVTSNGPRGPHILKIDRRDQAQRERESHEAARATAMGSVMPRLVTSSPALNGQTASLYSLAQSSLLNSVSLRELIERNYPHAQRQVRAIAKLLSEWNTDDRVCTDLPLQLLRNLLGTLLKGGK